MTDMLITTSAPSYGRTPRALLRDPKTSARAKALYALLDDYADTEGRAFPSRSTLADSLGCSVDSVDRAVSELEAGGWLRRVVRRREDRTFRATLYVLDWIGGSRTGAATQSHGCGGGSRTGAAGVAARVPTEEEPQEEEPQEGSAASAAAERPEVDELVLHLAGHVETNTRRTPRPGKKSWHDPIRLMLDKDGMSVPEVRALIDWCQNDEFWWPNVQSGTKLRRHAVQMLAQRDRRAPATVHVEGVQSATERFGW